MHEIQEGTRSRVRHRRVSEETGEEVSYDHVVKGVEVRKGKHVVLTKEELESLQPKGMRTIDIQEFVELDDIDPIVWRQAYYLGPDDSAGARKAYATLGVAMRETKKVAIGRFVMRSKEHLVTVRPLGHVLGVETMWYADEIRSTEELGSPLKGPDVSSKELALAKQLIGALVTPWDHGKHRDEYRERLMDLVNRKARGEEIELAPAPEGGAQVVDLMEALRASLGETGTRRGARSARRNTGDDLSRLSRSQLLARASRANIRGRSHMKRDELLAALRSAS